jgi:predicted Rossmann-fold nucleotide-binding protein
VSDMSSSLATTSTTEVPNNVNNYDRADVNSRVTVYGSSRTLEGSKEWNQAQAVGRLAAERGMSVISGGYNGTMKAVSQGAAEGICESRRNDDAKQLEVGAGGEAAAAASDPKIHGILCPGQFPDRALVGNQYLTDSIDAENMCYRIHHLTSMSRYFVILPGTMGTLMELSSIWCLWYIHPEKLGPEARPVMLAFRDPWEPVIEAIIKGLQLPDSQHIGAIQYVDTAEDIYKIIDADRSARTEAAASKKE